MIHFVHPLWLLLPLLVFPAALVALGGGNAMRRRAAGIVPDRLRARLLPADEDNHMIRRLASRFLLLLFLGVAMARPQFGEESVIEVAEARDIMLAIDTSRSMLATDTPPNRLDRARMASLDLLKSLPDDRFGVLGFAGSAFPLAPLTTDHDAIRETIANIDTDTLPVGGTSLAAAVERSMEVFEDLGPRRRALVILSDGEDLEGRLDGVAKKAKDKGILIFAFAIGTEHGAMIPDPDSPDGFVRDQDNRPVLSRQSLAALEKLATATGGYARVLSDSGSLPAQMADAMQLLEKSAAEEKNRSQAAEQFQWPLGIALALCVLCLALGAPRGRGIRAAAVLALGYFLLCPARGHAAGDALSTAVDLHNKAQYDEAIRAGAEAILDPHPPRRAVAAANLGNSLYERGLKDLGEDEAKITIGMIDKTLLDWEDALGHMNHSLALRPGDKPTTANRDAVAEAIDILRKTRQQKENQQQQQQQKKDQQKKDQQKNDQQDPKDQQDDQQQGGGDKDKQQQSGKDGKQKDDGKDGDEKKDDGQKDGKDGDKPDQGEKPKPGEKPGDDGKEPGKDEEEKQGKDGDKPGDNDGKEPGKDGDLPDASTGEQKPGRTGASSMAMQIGKDGRILLPQDPKEREKFLDTIRRNLEQRSMEDKKLKLAPPPKGARQPLKNW